MRRPSLAVNAALVIMLVAGAAWAYATVSGSGSGQQAAASVRTVPVQQGTVTASVTADGSVESASAASATFVTGGTVTAIEVRVGDTVKRGEVLAKVDPAGAERDLEAAQADLDAARDALERAQEADADTASADNEVTQAELAVDDAEADVDGTVLKAPMAGTVVAVNGTLGSSSSGSASSATAGGATSGDGAPAGGTTGGGSTTSAASDGSASGFVELADLTKLQVTADFAEADATRLMEGQAATITWNALSGTRQSGKVAAIDPQATTSNNVVTYGVTLNLDKVPAGAKPGQTVSVSVVTGEAQNATYVNSAAVTTTGNRRSVTVVTNGQQQVRQVQIGLEGDQTTQIMSGVTAGEQVTVTTSSTTGSAPQGDFPAGGGGFPGGAPGGGR